VAVEVVIIQPVQILQEPEQMVDPVAEEQHKAPLAALGAVVQVLQAKAIMVVQGHAEVVLIQFMLLVAVAEREESVQTQMVLLREPAVTVVLEYNLVFLVLLHIMLVEVEVEVTEVLPLVQEVLVEVVPVLLRQVERQMQHQEQQIPAVVAVA
jgi:hypothetical protein